ncbi:MAG: DMT family transporter [Elusimicrobia bacterium]|nr:DMT family transporter [Elusimicrobiota bacterium]
MAAPTKINQLWPALLAPLLFGLGTAAAKGLLADLSPVLLAGLLYLGSGLGLGLVWLLRGRGGRTEGALGRADLPWLAGAILCGGVAGPVLMMSGLARTSSSAASLLLNLEMSFTAIIAWTLFGERATARLGGGLALALAGAAVLSWPEPGGWAQTRWQGSLLIAAACLAWGLDNNLSQRISGKDPVSIAAIKGLAAGIVNCAFAFAGGALVPGPLLLGKAGLLGFLSYGVSLVCFILSLRRIGSARTGLFFGLAPFFGAAAGILFLREPVTPQLLLGAAFMAAGAGLALSAPSE